MKLKHYKLKIVTADGMTHSVPFSVPCGEDGEPGKMPNIKVGQVNMLPQGSNASVTITGTPEEPILNFSIPSGGGGSASVRISTVSILANRWVGTSSPYSQVVTVEGATKNSQVDLTPSVEQLAIFHEKDLAFVTENEDGVVTVYAIGQKPENDYTIQVTITEVYV